MKIKEILDSGKIGELFYVDSSRVNLGLHQFDVSVIWDLCPHDLSMILHWVGAFPRWIQCIGQSFAEMEGRLTLASLAQHFTPRLLPGHRVVPEALITLRPKGGLPMRLVARAS